MTVDDRTPPDLRSLAPEAFAAWDSVLAALAAADPDPLDAIPALVGSVLGFEPLAVDGRRSVPLETRRGETTADAGELAILDFGEQFVADVGGITPDQRAAALAALGPNAFAFVQVLYVVDLGSRMRAAWGELFGTEVVAQSSSATDLWAALEEFMPAVARLDGLDPVITEIVRLRGARAHGCRLCQSIRNVRAANAGIGESVYDQIDGFETSGLEPAHKIALRLVDAMLWTPGRFPPGLGADVRAEFGDAAAVELVLDVVRNAANKIAVAFGADAPHVTDGLEYYDIDPSGQLVYGLTPTSGPPT